MSWWDKLKGIIDIKINLNSPIFQININKNSNNNINLENGYHYEPDKKILHIHPDLIPEIKEALPQITKDYIEEGNRLLEHNADELLNKLYQYKKENPHKGILSFFQPIIPINDLEALEASLFLREQFKQGANVSVLKDGIRKRFGDRGNNIANLCTAGYFEKFLIPLYNSSSDAFKEIYEVIVSKSVVAVFVHGSMKAETIPKEITKRINISKKYGIKFIHIHGISKRNIDKIKKCIEEQKKYFEFFDKKIFENDEKDIIVVELLFK